jgi:uncharacterized membrane protein YfcA
LFDGEVLEVLLAIFLIAMSLLFLIKKELVILPNKRNAIAGGIVSGFSAGLLGTGGAIRGLTMAAFNLDKNAFIATSAFIDFFIDSTRTIVYHQNGYIRGKDMIYIPFLLTIGLLGTYIGKRILKYIPEIKFRRLSLSLILFIGFVMMLKVWFDFADF